MASSTSRSSGTKKTSTRKTAAKKQSGSATKKSGSSAPRAESRPAATAAKVAAQAATELIELTGKAIEGVTGLERGDDGWIVQIEVVEVRRIPDTTDVLALYEVKTDKQGSLEGYRRLRRYARGVPGDD
jgi:Gas vesicle synthesis protein GvpO